MFPRRLVGLGRTTSRRCFLLACEVWYHFTVRCPLSQQVIEDDTNPGHSSAEFLHATHRREQVRRSEGNRGEPIRLTGTGVRRP